MKQFKLLCFLLIASLVIPVLAKSPKDKNKYGVYIAGVSASFSDSLVYFTDIQYVDSASLSDNGLLIGRAQYSIQLKEYLEQKENGKNRTCFVYYNKKKKNLQKEINKLKEKYQKGNALVLIDVNPEFQFKKAIQY
ncbi:hypothetical protein Bacsa_0295 [Phocaeicola salanitronis DSM 18170]|jgi:hypothetical protein|uniref:Uncharacterized protein n=1 Tax=Phocaeicola salanitronis (strain DSM 18170 / JCM 13657 / CCUG 60908 / BL78) TaxID=667015 RepID=F0R6Y2_PHOSB|nr:hypothetical protein [Phocaeicola salanitronis]ADY34899.1 hypothetical protein Bacsa_0295 [Phocaeicola salanitronis DSM 18170]